MISAEAAITAGSSRMACVRRSLAPGLGLILVAALASETRAAAPPRPPRARAPAPQAALSPGTASCRPCPRLPCTRPCLPALKTDGPAELRPYSGQSCPTLTPGWNRNFGHNRRDLLLEVPTSMHGPFAVVFFWPAAGNAESIAPILARHFDTSGYLLVIPDPGAKYPLVWNMDAKGAGDDLRFFDDVMACLDAQFPIDRRRVHSAGYSTGAVFSAYLMAHRADVLASFVSYSGGDQLPSGDRLVPMPARPVPGLLYHGGDDDSLWAGKRATLSLAERMRKNGQPAMVCDHGRGHVVGASTKDMWAFMLAHPFGMEATASSRQTETLPAHCTDR